LLAFPSVLPLSGQGKALRLHTEHGERIVHAMAEHVTLKHTTARPGCSCPDMAVRPVLLPLQTQQVQPSDANPAVWALSIDH
jgi:hypothetical protein